MTQNKTLIEKVAKAIWDCPQPQVQAQLEALSYSGADRIPFDKLSLKAQAEILPSAQAAITALQSEPTNKTLINKGALSYAHEMRKKQFQDCNGAYEASTKEIIEWYLSALQSEQAGVNEELLGDAIENSLKSYNLKHHIGEDESIGLADILTPVGEGSVEKGLEEIELLTDHILFDLEQAILNAEKLKENV